MQEAKTQHVKTLIYSPINQQLNSVNKKNLQKQAEDLANQKNLHFDKNETEKLVIKFTELTQNNKRPFLDRNQFRFVFYIFFIRQYLF